jgi:hypothetical protein
MLIKTGRDGFLHPQSSEITPEAVYRQRRDMLRLLATGAAGAALASWAGREALAQSSGKLAPLPAQKSRARRRDHGEGHRVQGRQHLQQLLRVRHRQGRSGQERAHAQDPPWTVEVDAW